MDNTTEFEKNHRDQEADAVIRNHLVWAMGAGFIPVPIADFFAVGAIQLDMVRQLCRVYEIAKPSFLRLPPLVWLDWQPGP